MLTIKENVEVICFVFLTVVIVFGAIGNIVSLVVWSKGTNSKTLVCSTYFKLVSIGDICVLLISGIYEVLRLYPVRYMLTEYNDFLCKSVTFGRLFTTQISTWLVVAVTVERTACTLFPLKYRLDKARKRAYSIGLVITVLAFLSNSLSFFGMAITNYNIWQDDIFYSDTTRLNFKITTWFLNVTESHTFNKNGSVIQSEGGLDQMPGTPSSIVMIGFQNWTKLDQHSELFADTLNRTSSNLTNEPGSVDGRICDFVNLPRKVESIAWTVNYVVMICIVPLSIILPCNLAILVRLCTLHKVRNSATERNLGVSTRLVLAVGVVFILSTFPMTLYVLSHLKIMSVTLDLHGQNILPDIARSLFCLNNGTNFFLYFVSGKKFRQDLKYLFKSGCNSCKHILK